MIRLLCTLMMLGVTSTAFGQRRVTVIDPWTLQPVVNPLDDRLGFNARERAKARFEMSQMSLDDHRQARYEALTVELNARFKEFLAGRGSLDAFLVAQRHWAEAARDAQGGKMDRVATAWSIWEVAWEAHHLSQLHYEAGAADVPLFMQVRRQYALLSLAALEAKNDPTVARPLVQPERSFSFHEKPVDPSAERERLTERFIASERGPDHLRRLAVDATRTAFDANLRAFFRGRASPHMALRSWRDVAETSALVDPSPENQLNAALVAWEATRTIEALARYNQQDSLLEIIARLDAEIRLLDVLKTQGKTHAHGPLPLTFDFLDARPEREIARARFALAEMDRDALLRRRTDAGEIVLDARFKYFLVRGHNLDSLFDASRQQLVADLAVARTPAERRTARERHWSLTWVVCGLSKARYEAGALNVQDLQRTRAALEQAAIELKSGD